MVRYLPFCGLLLLTACHTTAPPPPSQYSFATPVPPLALRFAANSADLSGDQIASLRAMTRLIPATSTVDVYEFGVPAQQRAQRIARLLQRTVRRIDQPTMPTDEAVVSVPPNAGIIADACRGRAGRTAEDFWPGNDSSGALFLPPGCATAMSIAAQTTAPTDLLVGRPLPPGAALPYAQAIERYYRRNDAARKQDQSDQQDAGGDSGATAPAGTGSASAPGSAANPLLGGVPAQAH